MSSSAEASFFAGIEICTASSIRKRDVYPAVGSPAAMSPNWRVPVDHRQRPHSIKGALYFSYEASMPRRPRTHLDAIPLHIVQRGNNRNACFFGEDDY
jgi:hypothetical protein